MADNNVTLTASSRATHNDHQEDTDNAEADSSIQYRTIPHGLTYKHETRHHSSSVRRHSTSPKKTSSIVELKRIPLTCVKDTNCKTLDVIGAKHDLTSILTTVDKENGSKLKLAENEGDAEDSTDDISSESDVSPQKLVPVPALINLDDDEVQSSPVNSHQSRRLVNKKRGPGSEPLTSVSSDIKRPHLDDGRGVSSYTTPVRIESDGETAPRRAHHSRIIDESKMDGDANNMVLDVENSPLANVSQGSIVDQEIEGETEVFRQLKESSKNSIHDIGALDANSSLNNDSDSETDSNARMSPVRINASILSPLARITAKADSVERDEGLQALEQKRQEIEKQSNGERFLFTSQQVAQIRQTFEVTVNELNDNLEVKNSSLDDLRKRLAESEESISQLNVQLEQISSEKKGLEAQIGSMKLEITSATDFAADMDKKNSIIGLKLRICESKLEKYKELYSELMETAKSLQDKWNQERDSTGKLKDEVTEANLKVKKFQLAESETKASFELKQAEVKSLLEERSENEVMIKSLKGMNDDNDSELKKLKARLNATKEKLEEARKEAEMRIGEVSKADEQIRSLNSELSKSKEQQQQEIRRLQDESKSKLEKLTTKKNAEISQAADRVRKEKQEEVEKELSGHRQKEEELRRLLGKLRSDNEQLRKEHGVKNDKLSKEMKIKVEKTSEEMNKLKEKNSLLESELAAAKEKVSSNEKNVEEQLEKLAQDLYLQYSAKHEQKVATLKKGYEMKWMGKVKKFTKDNETLKQEIAGLKKKLEIETNEKKQLVKLWDEYVSLEKRPKGTL
ncbi:DEKNAAC102900 [Brettanomyces naardenensis]|uniref:DEKNAAC102900 n=1 Tax=Brettanomyces naardenensis TaxID=13370 RepID=A0A448YLV2_BRENA|nr:DEKNAAC102900 [Brettanomyces naardenensis]